MTVPVFLAEFVRAVIIMTLSGGALSLTLLLVKPLIRHRLPRAVQYYLWLVALASLIIPVSRFIVLPDSANTPIHAAVERNVITANEEMSRINRFDAFISAPDAVRPAPDEPSPLTGSSLFVRASSGFMLFYPWAALSVLFYNVIAYTRFTNKLRRCNVKARRAERQALAELCAGKRAPRLYRNTFAATPMLVGVIRPAIILPDREYTSEELPNILLHELTHLRRSDIVIKWLSVLACALHWFNPAVWLTRREIDRACELSCDEAVIRNLDAYEKQLYGNTLISVAADSKIPLSVLSTTMCEQKKALKERLASIMKSKRHTKSAVIISAVILLAAVCAACALGASSGGGNTPAAPDNGGLSEPGTGNAAPGESETPPSVSGVTAANEMAIIGTWEDSIAKKQRTQGASAEEFSNFTDEERERYFEEFGTSPGITLEFKADGTFSGNIWSEAADGTYTLNADGTYKMTIAAQDNIWTAAVSGDSMVFSEGLPKLTKISGGNSNDGASTAAGQGPVNAPTETLATFNYVTEMLGISVELPEFAEDAFGIELNYVEWSERGGTGMTIYHKATRDAGRFTGDVLYIERWLGIWSQDNPPVLSGTMEVVGQSDKYTYMLRTASGLEYDADDPETAAICGLLYAQRDAIGKSVKIVNQTASVPNASYQTEAEFLSENMQFRETAYGAAAAVLRADAEKLSDYLLEPSQAAAITRGLTDVYDDLLLLEFRFALSDIISDSEIRTSYEYTAGGNIYNNVSMTLKKQGGEWKADWIGIE